MNIFNNIINTRIDPKINITFFLKKLFLLKPVSVIIDLNFFFASLIELIMFFDSPFDDILINKSPFFPNLLIDFEISFRNQNHLQSKLLKQDHYNYNISNLNYYLNPN